MSHGNPVICEVGVNVTLNGLAVGPGDLLHGDVNGLLVIPSRIADRVAAQAMKVREAEAKVLAEAIGAALNATLADTEG